MPESVQSRQVVLSLGVDSVALLTRWIHDPASRDFDLRDLVVVTAMTGEELPRTRLLMQTYVLPLIRRNAVRYVQLCRAGQAKATGYVTLSDTRMPIQMYMRGPWRLSDELRSAGTLPSVRKGRRWCSDRAKGEVVDAWVRDHMQPGYVHVTGYAAEERRRAERDTAARREKEAKGAAVPCRPLYPLLDRWCWDRDRCAGYLRDVFGVEFSRSCCGICPFQETAGSRDELAERWRSHPEVGADALELEYTALAMNPNIGVFGTGRTAADFAAAHCLDEAITIARRRLDAAPSWDVLEVRRFFTAKDGDATQKGQPFRSVRVVATGTRDHVLAWVGDLDDAEVEVDRHGITRAWRRRRAEKPTYPAVDWVFAVVPSGVKDKERGSFQKRWNELHALALF